MNDTASILVLDPGTGEPTPTVPVPQDGTVVTDLSDGLEFVSDRLQSGGSVDLAVITHAFPRPLSAGRELRRADGHIGLVFVTEPGGRDAMESRLGLAPELRGAVVVDATSTPAEVEAILRRASGAASRGRGLRSALDEMNRQLLERSPRSPRSAANSVAASYLAALLRHMPEAVVTVDADGRAVSANQATADILGVDLASVEGTNLTETIAVQQRDRLARMVERACAGDATPREELWLTRPDGTEILLAVTAAPVGSDGGETVGAVVVARDITEARRSAERLRELQKAQSLATLAGGVAHDFNNLLATITGWVELAREDLDDTETTAAAFASISDAAERAADLARAMLAYSGRGEFELHPTDVSEIVRGLADLLRASIGPKVELKIDLTDDLPTVSADATQLRQILMNLVTNAAEALDDRDGTVRIATGRRDHTDAAHRPEHLPADRYVSLEVADDGPGIEPETLDRIFEPFFSTKFAGRGLGLAASQGIARAHGGALLVESEPGDGATFTVLLPIDGSDR